MVTGKWLNGIFFLPLSQIINQITQLVEKRSKSGSRIGSKACKQAGSYALKRRTIDCRC